jgi:hypothetical protein
LCACCVPFLYPGGEQSNRNLIVVIWEVVQMVNIRMS